MAHFIHRDVVCRAGSVVLAVDANLNGKEMTADLEAMKAAWLGNLVFLEVDLGMPKGQVRWMTGPWQDRFVQIIRDAERLGIDVTLGIGPGWCGSGGPWIKPEQSMQHLVFSSVDLQGPQAYSQKLPLPAQREEPFLDMRNPYYEDVAVLAFPSSPPVVADIHEKALYKREPHSIWKHVKTYLPTSARYPESGQGKVVVPDSILRFRFMSDTCAGLIPVRKVGQTHIWYTPWDYLIRWWGVSEAMLDLIDRPELVHAAVDRMVTAWRTELDQFTAQNLLSPDANNTRIGSGGYGYTKSLPDHAGGAIGAQTQQMWGCSNAQIFSEVSPDMHWEFALKHDIPWLSRWGLAYYGCCEPLDFKLDLLSRIPNLRKISMNYRK